MTNVLPFRNKAATTKNNEAYTTLKDALAKEERGEMHGLILIESTADGDRLNVGGVFADRLQHGAMVLIKALNEVADRIRDSGSAGYSSSPTIKETLPTRAPMPQYLTTSKFGDL